MKTYYPMLAVLACVAAVACSSARPTATVMADAVPPAKEQTWQLVEMRGREVPRSSEAITLVLNPEAGTASGQSACNRYHAQLRLRAAADGFDMQLEGIGATRVQCPEAKMNREQRYLALLAKADHLRVAGYELELTQHGKTILKYELQ